MTMSVSGLFTTRSFIVFHPWSNSADLVYRLMIPAALKPNYSQKAILPWDYGGFASRLTCSFALIRGKLLNEHGFPWWKGYSTILRVGDVSLFGVRVPRLMKCTRRLGECLGRDMRDDKLKWRTA